LVVAAYPLDHLHFLNPPEQAHDVRRVCLLGAESTGKTSLAAALAGAYDTVWVPEYGHIYQALGRDDPHGPWSSDEFVKIARIQLWFEDFMATQARQIMFCDTDVFTTALWHEALVGEAAPDELRQLADASRYDLFLLCSDDIPFEQDVYGLRKEERRRWMQQRYLARLEGGSSPWIRVSGALEARVAQASPEIDALLKAGAPTEPGADY
jgi:HTH-type transcriptional regulator, transcriptional repressor of NAD biosynthesis genes